VGWKFFFRLCCVWCVCLDFNVKVFGLFVLYSLWSDSLDCTVCGGYVWTVLFVIGLFRLYALLGLFGL